MLLIVLITFEKCWRDTSTVLFVAAHHLEHEKGCKGRSEQSDNGPEPLL